MLATRMAIAAAGPLTASREPPNSAQTTPAMIAVMSGMPLEEVARGLETNRNALYKLLHDARRRLRRKLLADGHSPQDILAGFAS